MPVLSQLALRCVLMHNSWQLVAAACSLSSFNRLPCILSSCSTTAFSSAAKDQAAPQSDEYFWIPHETVSPANIAQKRATGRVETAIESVLLADGAIREHLVHRYGLNIQRVQISKDRRTVFILWDANHGQAQQCQLALEKNAFRLRRELAKVMKSKVTPYLEFRHNHLPPHKAAAASAMELVEKELADEAATHSTEPGQPSIDAAIERLELSTKPVN